METTIKTLEEVLGERKPKKIGFRRLSGFDGNSYDEWGKPIKGSQEDMLEKTKTRLYELCQEQGYQVVDGADLIGADLIITYHHCPCCMTGEEEGIFLRAAYIMGKEKVLILFPKSSEIIESNLLSRIDGCHKKPEYLLPVTVSFEQK